MINALVLAAGESKRMGMPKPLLRFGATTFLEQILDVLQRSTVDKATVVLGSHAPMVRELTDRAAVDAVVNRAYRGGQLSSLCVGLRSMPAETEAIVLCLADNPFITVEVVNRVVEAFRNTRRPIVIPVCSGRRGHPTLFARPVFEELLSAPAEKGARHVVQTSADRVLEVVVSEPAILISIDTPEDYRAHLGSAPTIQT